VRHWCVRSIPFTSTAKVCNLTYNSEKTHHELVAKLVHVQPFWLRFVSRHLIAAILSGCSEVDPWDFSVRWCPENNGIMSLQLTVSLDQWKSAR
jgi:hypothetical protein